MYICAWCCAADTKRFEGIDSEFKELMKEAINVPMAVDACGVDGRAEGLKSMMQRLEMCQKSLNEYLDMKKKVGHDEAANPRLRGLLMDDSQFTGHRTCHRYFMCRVECCRRC